MNPILTTKGSTYEVIPLSTEKKVGQAYPTLGIQSFSIVFDLAGCRGRLAITFLRSLSTFKGGPTTDTLGPNPLLMGSPLSRFLDVSHGTLFLKEPCWLGSKDSCRGWFVQPIFGFL